MSKKIHTIQSSDKIEFDKEVNFFLELGCELLEGSYEVVKEDNGNVYSQVVTIDTNKFDVEYYDNGQIKFFCSLNKDGKMEGLLTSCYENGQKEEQVTIKDGKRDGLETRWYENGKKKTEGTIKDGKMVGLLTSWYENGQKKKEITLNDGEKRDGLCTSWFENGQKMEEVTYKDGKKDGLETTWHENGQKMYEGTYVYGIEVGKWTAYNEDGTVKTVWEESKYTQGLTLKRKVK